MQMDGVDDRLQLPSMTLTEIVLEMSAIRQTNAVKMYIDARTGISFCYLQSNTNGTDSWSTFNNVYVDGVAKTNNTTMIPENQKCTVRVVKTVAGTDDVSIFSTYSGSANNFAKGSLYNIKVYNGATLQAHYDMSTGTVQDISGNGNHATLNGGTWLDDGTGGTPTGTAGSQACGMTQEIYRVSSLSVPLAEEIFRQSSEAFPFLLEYYTEGVQKSESFALKIEIYRNSNMSIPLVQEWYKTAQAHFNMQQILIKTGYISAQTKQVIFKEGANTHPLLLSYLANFQKMVKFQTEITQRYGFITDITPRIAFRTELTQRSQFAVYL